MENGKLYLQNMRSKSGKSSNKRTATEQALVQWWAWPRTRISPWSCKTVWATGFLVDKIFIHVKTVLRMLRDVLEQGRKMRVNTRTAGQCLLHMVALISKANKWEPASSLLKNPDQIFLSSPLGGPLATLQAEAVGLLCLLQQVKSNFHYVGLDRTAPPHLSAIQTRRLSKPSRQMRFADLTPHRHVANRSGRALGQGT